MNRKSNWVQLLQIHEIRVLLAGALLVTSCVLVLGAVGLYGYYHDPVNRQFFATVAFDDGTGIVRGTRVLVRGVDAGSVDDIELDSVGRVIMTLKLPDKYLNLIHTNWVCYPTRERNLMSDRVLNIDDTAVDPHVRLLNVQRYATLMREQPDLATSRVRRVSFRTANGRDVESMFQAVSRLANESQRTLDHINTILNQVTDTAGSIGLLIKRREAYLTGMQALQEARSAIADAQQGATHLSRVSAFVDRRVPVITDSLQMLLSSTSTSMRAVNRVINRGDTLITDTRDLMHHADGLIDRSDRLIDGTTKSWPFRSYLKNSGSKTDRIPTSPLP